MAAWDSASGGGTGVVRDSHVPLFAQIEEELRSLIESAELGPGAQVPSEVEVAERFGVSRMTARKAIERLVADGLLFRQPGKGTFVSAPKISHIPSQQLSFSAAMRALGLQYSTRVLQAGMVVAPSSIGLALNIPFGSPAVFMRRLRLVEGIPAAIHTAWLPPRLAPLLDVDLSGSLSEAMAALGARVESARDTLEAIPALADEAELLEIPVGAPLLFIRGGAYSATREPLRYSEGRYRADRFRFSFDMDAPADLRMELKSEVRR